METNKLLLEHLTDDLKSRRGSNGNNNNNNNISNSSSISSIFAYDMYCSPISSLVRLLVLEDNFLDISYKWIDSDIVIIRGTCFQADVLHPIYNKCRLLKEGSVVIVVDQIHLHDDSWLADDLRSSSSSSSSSNNNNNSNNISSSGVEYRSYLSDFRLVSSCEAISSWGVGCVYFYIKN